MHVAPSAESAKFYVSALADPIVSHSTRRRREQTYFDSAPIVSSPHTTSTTRLGPIRRSVRLGARGRQPFRNPQQPYVATPTSRCDKLPRNRVPHIQPKETKSRRTQPNNTNTTGEPATTPDALVPLYVTNLTRLAHSSGRTLTTHLSVPLHRGLKRHPVPRISQLQLLSRLTWRTLSTAEHSRVAPFRTPSPRRLGVGTCKEWSVG